MVYIVEKLVLQTIFVLNEEILLFLDQKSAVIIKSGFKSREGLLCTIGEKCRVRTFFFICVGEKDVNVQWEKNG